MGKSHLDIELPSLTIEKGEKENWVVLVRLYGGEEVLGRFSHLVRYWRFQKKNKDIKSDQIKKIDEIAGFKKGYKKHLACHQGFTSACGLRVC